MKRHFVLCLCLLGCLLAALPALAQEGPRGNQLLFIVHNGLFLWDAEQEHSEYLFDLDPEEYITSAWNWDWSPDGRYIMADYYGVEPPEVRLYDIETRTWDDRTFGQAYAWSPDGRTIAHARPTDYGANMYLYDWESGESTLLLSVEGRPTRTEGLAGLGWSPNGEILAFTYYEWIMGGSINHKRLLNLATGEVHELAAGLSTMYIPIWSPDGNYLLIQIDETPPDRIMGYYYQDEVVGDIYLFDAHTGEKQRITHTPFQEEWNVHWSEDGQTILYETRETREVALADAFSLPETVDIEIPPIPDMIRSGASGIKSTSPDGSIQVWGRLSGECGIDFTDGEGNYLTGETFLRAESGCPTITVIGWRPLPPS